MKSIEAEYLFLKGLKALDHGKTPAALNFFERAARMEPTPVINSYYAYCMAKERGLVNQAVTMCLEALDKDPGNAEIYLNLGRVHLAADNKAEALRVLREGLNIEKNPKIIEELERLGTRRRPAIPFLKRTNPLNRYLGLVINKLSGKDLRS